MAYPGPYEIYKRYDLARGEEVYSRIAAFDHEPTRTEISDAYSGRVRKEESAPTGIWYVHDIHHKPWNVILMANSGCFCIYRSWNTTIL